MLSLARPDNMCENNTRKVQYAERKQGEGRAIIEQERKFRVFMAVADANTLRQVCELAAADEELALVGTTTDGDHVAGWVRECRPALIVLDTELPHVDGLTAAARVRAFDRRVGILLLSAFMGSQICEECELLEVGHVMRKPVRPQALYEQLRLWMQTSRVRQEEAARLAARRRASAIVQEFGVKLGKKGRLYIIDAILLSSQLHSGVTKDIYPAIAKTYHTTQKNVERVVRYAVNTIWTRSAPAILAKYFGQNYANEHSSIGSSTFCSILSEFVHTGHAE